MTHSTEYDQWPGLWTWLAGGHRGFERHICRLHRVTGLGLLFFFGLHIVVTSLRVQGVYLWSGDDFLHGEIFEVLEYAIFAAFAFHACNGVRVLVLEWMMARKGADTIACYCETPMRMQRVVLITMGIAAAVVLAIGTYGAMIEELAE